MKLLFIAWDGNGDHYMRGLFLPIMSALASQGFHVDVLHMSSMPANTVSSLNNLASSTPVNYHHIKVQRSNMGFVKSFWKGIQWLKAYKKQNKSGWVMPRSLMPALLVRGAQIKTQRVIYDADGLALDERIDFAGWTEGQVKYKFFKQVEKWATKNAVRVLVRTQLAKQILLERYPYLKTENIYKVINGKNEEVFQPLNESDRARLRADLGIGSDDLLIVYCGTIAPQYCLDEMFAWFLELKSKSDREVHFLFLTGQQDMVRMHKQFDSLEQCIILKTVSVEEVPRWLSSADLALALRRSSFSMRGVSPIKIGEYLLCGLPVIASKGIGDTQKMFENLSFSQLINESDESDLLASANKFANSLSKEAKVPLIESVQAGEINYGMKQAVQSYLDALK